MPLLAAALLISLRGSVTVTEEPYRIWPHSFCISNGVIECVVVPAIGRVMRVGRVGGPNLLFESPLKPDGAPEFGGVWNNFGGDKIWPAPQSAWNWPPEAEYDTAIWKTEAVPGGLRMWTTQPGTKTGLILERRIHLGSNGYVIDFENRYTNATQSVTRCAGWQICQVADPTECRLPRDPTPANPKGWSTYDPIDVSALTHESGAVVTILRSKTRSAKFGSTSTAGYVSALVGQDLLTLSSAHPKGEYVDGGKAEQIYISQDPAKYAEIEITGPMKTLAPGASLIFSTKLALTHSPR